MKKFSVGVTETIGGYAVIEAKTAEEAKAKVQIIMDDEGIEGLKQFKVTHRETDVFDISEVK